jgi:hypothetical protein
VRRAWLAVALALVACGPPAEPTAFGVNVHVLSGALSSAQRHAIVSAQLNVTGDGTPFSMMLPGIGDAIAGGELRFHYVPLLMSGTLTFEVDALAAGSTAPFLSGTSPPIALQPSAVDATISLLPLRCSDLVSCLNACSDAACIAQCRLAASTQATTKQMTLATCVDGVCTNNNGPCANGGGASQACSDCGSEAVSGTSPGGQMNGPCMPVAGAAPCGQCVAPELDCNSDQLPP